jgi:hypothetical protein
MLRDRQRRQWALFILMFWSLQVFPELWMEFVTTEEEDGLPQT